MWSSDSAARFLHIGRWLRSRSSGHQDGQANGRASSTSPLMDASRSGVNTRSDSRSDTIGADSPDMRCDDAPTTQPRRAARPDPGAQVAGETAIVECHSCPPEQITTMADRRALSPRARQALIAVGVVETILKVVMLLDLRRRQASSVRGSKRLWSLSTVVASAGVIPLTYFAFGRRRPS